MFGEIVERSDVFLGDDEDVNGRLRIEIAKGDTIGGIGKHLRRNFSSDYPAEHAIISHRRASLK
jgi:hypothetical protein